jgi:hypothetical protein
MYEWVNSIRGVQPRQRLVDLAKRRIKEEMESKGRLGGDDPYGQIVTSFVTRGNRVNDYDVASSCVSKHAIPLALLKQIRGETFMAGPAGFFACVTAGSSPMEHHSAPSSCSFLMGTSSMM